MKIISPSRRCLLGVAVALAATPTAFAQTYPAKPIRMVVGYAAGGATDVVARLVGQKMGEGLGQVVIVDNKPGANSNVGAENVARSPADGYTIYVYTIANTINASLYDRLGYDPKKDFDSVGLIAKVPNIMVVNPKLPVKTVAEFVKYAQAQPNGVTFASSGSGSSIHLTGEIFKMATHLDMLHVPYRGSSPAITDLMGGQVQTMFDNAPSVLPHIQGGRVRALAITSPQRSPLLPDVPTMAEAGYPSVDAESWFGLSVPAGTPRAVVDRLNLELNKAVASPEIRKRLLDLGATPTAGTSGQMTSFVAQETTRWAAVVKASGAKAD